MTLETLYKIEEAKQRLFGLEKELKFDDIEEFPAYAADNRMILLTTRRDQVIVVVPSNYLVEDELILLGYEIIQTICGYQFWWTNTDAVKWNIEVANDGHGFDELTSERTIEEVIKELNFGKVDSDERDPICWLVLTLIDEAS